MEEYRPYLKDAVAVQDRYQPVEKYNKKGILLVPTPSDDAADPLNWPSWRKHLLFAILCFGTFMGICSAISPALAIPAQSKSFNRSPQEVSYTFSGVIGGMILGPLIFIPTARFFGTCSVCLWTLVTCAAFCAWAGTASRPDDFISYAVARGFTGMVSPITQILTGGYIVDVYFRHQRGVAFAIYSTVYTLAMVAGASFCGFIVQHSHWSGDFWWLASGNGLAAVLILLFVKETAFSRNGNDMKGTGQSSNMTSPRVPWIAERWKTFFPGNRVVSPHHKGNLFSYLAITLAIGGSPATILAGLYTGVNFAWLVTIKLELPIYLAEAYAPSKGLIGYGFDAQETATFSFAMWIGILCAQMWGIAVNDRIPLYISRRKGVFTPELWLYPGLFPGLIIGSVGLGLFGASLRYHLHFMVLAVGSAMIAFGAVVSVPTSVQYIIESFPQYPQEVGTVTTAYRAVLGLAIPFFFQQWVEKVGIEWVFGMAAFFNVLVFLFVVLLLWKGPSIRKASLIGSSHGKHEQ